MLRRLAQMLVTLVKLGLVLYWIPLVGGPTLIALNFTEVLSPLRLLQWSVYFSLCWFLCAWWNAGAVFVAPVVLRETRGVKMIVRYLLLPFFVIPAYRQHGSDWFRSATDEMLTSWRQNTPFLLVQTLIQWIVLPLVLWVVYVRSLGNTRLDIETVRSMITFSIFIAELFFFMHLSAKWKAMRTYGWRDYLWLLYTYILTTTLVAMVILLVMNTLFAWIPLTFDTVVCIVLIFAGSMFFTFAHAGTFLYIGYLVICGFRYLRTKSLTNKPATSSDSGT